MDTTSLIMERSKMIHQENKFVNNLKTFGLVHLTQDNATQLKTSSFSHFIKILLLPKGYKLRVDFSEYAVDYHSLFFIAPNQVLHIDEIGTDDAYLLYYNSDFYCIQIHDAEVACNGLLFNNIHNMPQVDIVEENIVFIKFLLTQIESEFKLKDSSIEEMIRTYLKQLLIVATRHWKKQYLDKEAENKKNDLEFFRKFTLLVDTYYKEKHSVADYADLLYVAPKTITHKFKRLRLPQPNDIIKDRIVLEAKRLLAHTTLTSKEIAYELGYEDPAYFSKLFKAKASCAPSDFRALYS